MKKLEKRFFFLNVEKTKNSGPFFHWSARWQNSRGVRVKRIHAKGCAYAFNHSFKRGSDGGAVRPPAIETRERERERVWEGGEGGRRKMKKSPMPCERRDLSSVTPDEPADDDEERGNARPQATFTVRRKRHATQPARRLCWPVNVPPLTVGFSLFLVALIYGRYRWKYSPVRLLPSGEVYWSRRTQRTRI